MEIEDYQKIKNWQTLSEAVLFDYYNKLGERLLARLLYKELSDKDAIKKMRAQKVNEIDANKHERDFRKINPELEAREKEKDRELDALLQKIRLRRATMTTTKKITLKTLFKDIDQTILEITELAEERDVYIEDFEGKYPTESSEIILYIHDFIKWMLDSVKKITLKSSI
ncbi:hypothetical protein [Flavobacterium sp.]|jgi:hypothetical protein|uniref:hypothetical protein n=1 Tax=Flavobacterium sp. TaxID=239 RepID=UPI0037C0EC4D